MKQWPAIFLLPFLAGCASSSGVFPDGRDTYRLKTQASWEFGGRTGATRMAMTEATTHCAKQSKILKVLDSDESYGHFEGGIVSIRFSCIEK